LLVHPSGHCDQQKPERVDNSRHLEPALSQASQPFPVFGRCAGSLFAGGDKVKRLPPMPDRPTLLDYFNLRWAPANHVLQSATLAKKNNMTEEIILACLLHDVVQSLIKTAIRHHQTLRFYEDKEAGYEYPDLYRNMFGVDYVPPPHIQANYKWLKSHKWYILPRQVTVNDLYAFDPKAKVSIDPFVDIIGRHFQQPKDGLGNDNSAVAHMWRSMARPDSPL
jgi:hypothetical protein